MYTTEDLLKIASKCTPTPYNTAYNKYVVVNGEVVGEYYYIHIVELGNKSNHLYEVVLTLSDKPTVHAISSYNLLADDVKLVGKLTRVDQLTNHELRRLIHALVETYKVNGFDLSYCGAGLRDIDQAGIYKRIIIPFFLVVARIFGETSNPDESFFPQVYFTVPDEDGLFVYTEWTMVDNDGVYLPKRRVEIFASIDEFKKSTYYLSDETKYPRFVLDQQQVCLSLIEENSGNKEGGEK